MHHFFEWDRLPTIKWFDVWFVRSSLTKYLMHAWWPCRFVLSNWPKHIHQKTMSSYWINSPVCNKRDEYQDRVLWVPMWYSWCTVTSWKDAVTLHFLSYLCVHGRNRRANFVRKGTPVVYPPDGLCISTSTIVSFSHSVMNCATSFILLPTVRVTHDPSGFSPTYEGTA